jgi:hypothetical protein
LQGIAASADGESVVLLDGVYTGAGNTELDLGGKDIVVRSQNGRANCVLDGQSTHYGFKLHSNEPPTTRFDGLTFKNFVKEPYPYAGAAIEISNASATIANCAFTSCSAYYGGALFVYVGQVRVENCSFSSNTATVGAAIRCEQGGPLTIQSCAFDHNTSTSSGAVSISKTIPAAITHSSFRANTSSDAGGALWLQPAVASGQSIAVDDCLFAGNRGLRGSAIWANLPGTTGTAQTAITNCTFNGNHASATLGYRAAVLVSGPMQLSIANSILWGDTGAGGMNPELAIGSADAVMNVAYCDVQGGAAAVFHAGTLNWGAGNLDVDPLFVDPDGPDDDPQTFDDNVYRLQPTSPCIDAGDNTQAAPDLSDIDGDGDSSEPVPLDIVLKPRFKDVATVPDTGVGPPPIIDLGCYERQG